MKQLMLFYQVYSDCSLFYLDTPFTNGQFSYDRIPFLSLSCSGIQSDTSSLSSFLLSIVSLNLKSKIAEWIPNCIPLPACTTGEEVITIIRTTKSWASEEDFIIRNSNYVVYYRQPSVSDNQKYTWSVILCKGINSIVMTDTSGSWSSGSNVVLKVGSTTVGTYTCSSSSSSYTFTV